MPEELNFYEATVTCETLGCRNYNLPITVLTVGDVVCGPCWEPIEEVIRD